MDQSQLAAQTTEFLPAREVMSSCGCPGATTTQGLVVVGDVSDVVDVSDVNALAADLTNVANGNTASA